MILKSCLMILKCLFNVFFNDLSRRSKNFERDTYKGGRGALAPRPPLQVFSLTNCSDWCLSLVFFPFNPFWLAEALKNYILWTLDLLKHSFIFFSLAFSIDIFLYFVSFVTQSPSGGQKSMKTAPANPRRSLFENCFKSCFDTAR